MFNFSRFSINSFITLIVYLPKIMLVATALTLAIHLLYFELPITLTLDPSQKHQGNCTWKSFKYSQYRSFQEVPKFKSLGSFRLILYPRDFHMGFAYLRIQFLSLSFGVSKSPLFSIVMGRSLHCKVEQPHANKLHVKNVKNVHKASPKQVKFVWIVFSWVDIHNIYHIV